MDKTIEQVFKIFSHLAREIQTYIFSGLILLLNFHMIDRYYNDCEITKEIMGYDYYIVMLLIVAYILGQISLGFYCFVLEVHSYEERIYAKLFKDRYKNVDSATDEVMIRKKGEIFLKNREIYFHFIERNVNLALMRWNYSSAFLMIFLIDLGFGLVGLFFQEWHPIMLIIAFFSFIISAWLMVLHAMTQKENILQLNELKEIIPCEDKK
ncbi:MAG: hypothetical protein U0T69_09955 [Chitinophagales bacterium]